jgi:hypothetical protein
MVVPVDPDAENRQEVAADDVRGLDRHVLTQTDDFARVENQDLCAESLVPLRVEPTATKPDDTRIIRRLIMETTEKGRLCIAVEIDESQGILRFLALPAARRRIVGFAAKLQTIGDGNRSRTSYTTGPQTSR